MRTTITVAIILLSVGLQAQIMIPNTTTRTIQTPYGPTQLSQTMWTSYYPNYGGSQVVPYVGKTNMSVVLKSDSVFNERMFFNVADSIHSLTLDRKEKKGGDILVRPEDTKQISQVYDGKLMVGIPTDTCWLFKVTPGDINAYAPFPTNFQEFYTAIQKGDGPIMKLNKENLKEMVSDQPKLFKLIDKGKLGRAIWKYNGSN